ncbi:hypothetical protein [Pseudonocardia sp. H11422]|uniref:hypothetical protein n=1 Tax=Pseudonocardia sp. H11422 TaxID=2835866 RepID=UPI001BDD81DC|nr:hypothetical protein [Pseudonocardia sp. H11422]
MNGTTISLDRALELTRTGDIWGFRGRSGADRAIRGLTNSPVNHVGMSIVVDDLPPLMWHAELGRSLPDLWSGRHQRGVQLHDMRDAVLQWGHRYGQHGWLRQLDGPVTRELEDAALRTVARLDGTPFPSTARLASRWLRGRSPAAQELVARARRRIRRERDPEPVGQGTGLETAYCAEVVAVTYEEMGLLSADRRPNWYDPGRFWSGDALELTPGFRLGGEIAVALPPAPPEPERRSEPAAGWRRLLPRRSR